MASHGGQQMKIQQICGKLMPRTVENEKQYACSHYQHILFSCSMENEGVVKKNREREREMQIMYENSEVTENPPPPPKYNILSI